MNKYSKKSEGFVSTCTDAVQTVFREVLRRFDHKALSGARTLYEQGKLVESGASKTKFSAHVPRNPDGSYNPDGKSKALDAAPHPLEWPDESVMKAVLAKIDNDAELKHYIKTLARFYYFGGYVLGTSDAMGIPLTWGGDWDGDRDIFDQSFDDLVHFEEKNQGGN